jgi:hypothetical protein
MRPLPLVLLAAGLTTQPLLAQRSRAVIVVPGQLTQVVSDTMGTPYPVPFPSFHVYRSLLGVFADLKIPAEIRDSAVGRVESQVFYRRGELGGRQISTYLSCGEGITGPNADSYRVYMTIISTVEPKDAERSTVRTVFLAGAVNITEGARQPMPCESTGRLEIRIHQLLLKKAAGL